MLQEKTILYRRFTTLHCLLVIAVFAVAGVFIGWSGGKHSKATSKCESEFFPAASSTSTSNLVDTGEEGPILCNIFTWATFGIMVGLWLVLGLLEVNTAVYSSPLVLRTPLRFTFTSSFQDMGRVKEMIIGIISPCIPSMTELESMTC
jgi:hypothetical protein